LKEIEQLRYDISVPWGELIYESGAIVSKKPLIYHIIAGLLFQTARDSDVEVFKVVQFGEEPPFAKFKEGGKTSKEMIDTLNHFNKFIDICKKNKQLLKRLREEITEQLIKSTPKTFDADFRKSNKFENCKFVEERNQVLIKRANTRALDLQSIFDSIDKELKYFVEKQNKPEIDKENKERFKKINEENKTLKTDDRQLFFLLISVI